MSQESLSCEEAQSTLAELKSLKSEFKRAFDAAVKTGELIGAKQLRKTLESRIHIFRESLISPLERKLSIKEQYERERHVLKTTGVFEQLPSGEWGIMGIDGKPYPCPSYEEIQKLIKEKREMLEQKAEQGFVKLLLVPFGMKLDDLTEKYRAALLKHHAEGKLFATKKQDTDPDVPLELDTATPVWRWDKYASADVLETLVYDPKEFSQNHKGKTKTEMLKSGQAWRIVLIEDNPNIPRTGKRKPVGGRARIEANKTPKEYLEAIGKGEYQNESGTTPEEWLMQALSLLEEKNQVLDDYQGNGSIAYNTGAYFPASGFVPNAYWDRVARQAYLGGNVPADRDAFIGARSAVRVSS